jgi:hypothetical protein
LTLYVRKEYLDQIPELFNEYYKDITDYDAQAKLWKQAHVDANSTIAYPNRLNPRGTVDKVNILPNEGPLVMIGGGGGGGRRHRRRSKRHQADPATSIKEQALLDTLYAYLPLYIIKTIRVLLYQHLAKDRPLGSFSWRWLVVDIILTLIVYGALVGTGVSNLTLEAVLTDAGFGIIVITCLTVIMNMMQSDEVAGSPEAAAEIDGIIAVASPWILLVPVGDIKWGISGIA